ncbi:hypothetical protein [Allocoleopsis sp.]
MTGHLAVGLGLTAAAGVAGATLGFAALPAAALLGIAMWLGGRD